MRTTYAQLAQIRKDFKKRLSDIRRDEIRILSKLRSTLDTKKTQHIIASIKNVNS